MTKIAILGNFSDHQTGLYILESCRKFVSDAAGIDIRNIINEHGIKNGQKIILDEVNILNFTPDVVIVLKGLELTLETLKSIKEKWKTATFVNWFFDKYLLDKPIWETEKYFDVIKEYDYYFCSLKGVADKLKEKGLDNVKYLDEACIHKFHKETYVNHFQEQKYGEDIGFVGSIGYMKQHSNRIPILEKLVKEGFQIKIWGDVVCDLKYLSPLLKTKLMNVSVINDAHSKVVQSSLINLGIDQDAAIEMGHSARLYRVMCAGGLYLCNATKGLEKLFKVNKENEEITEDQELVLYYTDEDLFKKLDFLLEHDELRKKIAKNGKKAVLEKHTFTHRIGEMLQIIKKGDK